MTKNVRRRSLIIGSAAFGMTQQMPAWAAGCATNRLFFSGEQVSSVSVSKCPGIASEIQELDTELNRIQLAPDTTIEAMYRELENNLAASQSRREAAEMATKAAIQANDATIKDETIKAIRSTNDLVLATAMQTRNPNFIGAAVGVHVTTGTGVFAYQAMEAQNGNELEKATVVLFQDRKAMYSIMTSSPGRELAKKQAALVIKVGQSAYQIGQAVIDNNQLRTDLAELEVELQGLRSDIAGLPVNVNESRAYFANRIIAVREIYQLLSTDCSANDCQVNIDNNNNNNNNNNNSPSPIIGPF